MTDKNHGLGDVVDAILDLTRVTVALNGQFGSKAEAIRKLSELSIPASRIAAILSMSTSDVSSSLAKAKKKTRQNEDMGITISAKGDSNAENTPR